MKVLFSILSMFIFVGSFAQSVHTVADPDITFSIEVPLNWRVDDDGYTLAVIPPQGGREFLEFTYFETSETDLAKAFEFTVLAFNGAEALDTEIIDQGMDTVNGVPARWALLSLTLDRMQYYRLTYLLIKDGQYYIFKGTALTDNFKHYRPLFEQTIRSLATERNK